VVGWWVVVRTRGVGGTGTGCVGVDDCTGTGYGRTRLGLVRLLAARLVRSPSDLGLAVC
jgi:hypothetical protein